MLIEFKVKNYLSFKDEVLFSMEAGSSSQREQNIIKRDEDNFLLKSAVVFGANASGKSNLIKALSFVRFLLLKDYNLKEDTIRVVPFKLSEETEKEPSFFEIVFINKGIKYDYSFSLNNKMILEESLIEYSPNKRCIFKRVGGEIKQKGEKLTKKHLPDTKERELYLSTLARVFDIIEKDIISWFKNLIPLNEPLMGDKILWMMQEKKEYKERVLEYLKRADLTINNISSSIKDVDFKDVPQELKEVFLSQGRGVPDRITKSNIVFSHQKYDKNNNPKGEVDFNFVNEESFGTKHFFNLLGPIIDTIDNGKIMIVDELENSLHPLLLRFIVEIFNSKENKNAQLIFTAHDTSLISNNSPLRRDQIWFTDKNKYGATNLYSLLEFKDIREFQDFQKKYLLGNFGAIPIIDNLWLENQTEEVKKEK